MAKAKKEGNFLNIKMASSDYEILSKYCEITGQTKTIAIERAVRAYCLRMIQEYQKHEDLVGLQTEEGGYHECTEL